MDSPLLYDLEFGHNCMYKQKQRHQLNFNLVEEPGNDFGELDTPEASFDLNDLIDSNLPSEELFSAANIYARGVEKGDRKQDIAASASNSSAFSTHVPVSNKRTDCDMKQLNRIMNWCTEDGLLMNFGTEFGLNVNGTGLNEDVKPIIIGSQTMSNATSGSFPLNTLPTMLPNAGEASPMSQCSDHSNLSSGSSINKKKKNVDKASDVYRIRRERNNIAVRKSREKAKQRSRDREEKVHQFQKQNDKLQDCLNMLKREVSLLESLFSQESGLSHKVRQDIVDTFQRIKNLS